MNVVKGEHWLSCVGVDVHAPHSKRAQHCADIWSVHGTKRFHQHPRELESAAHARPVLAGLAQDGDGAAHVATQRTRLVQHEDVFFARGCG